jgi:hypothetical protein
MPPGHDDVGEQQIDRFAGLEDCQVRMARPLR